MLCTWLTDRLDRSLHPYQCTCLALIVKVPHFHLSFSIDNSSVFQVSFQFFKKDLEKSSCLQEILHSTTFQFDYERVYNEYQSLAKRGIFLYLSDLSQSSMMQCNFGGFLAVEGLFSVFGSGFPKKFKNHEIKFFRKSMENSS